MSKLPPLPEPRAWRVDASYWTHYDSIPSALLPPMGEPEPLHAADQLRSYGQACWEAAIEAAVQRFDRIQREQKRHFEAMGSCGYDFSWEDAKNAVMFLKDPQ